MTSWEQNNNREVNNRTPFAMARLQNPTSRPIASYSYTDETQYSSISYQCKKYTVNNHRIVHKMPLGLFKQCLVNHFDIRYKMQDITWPTRNPVRNNLN